MFIDIFIVKIGQLLVKSLYQSILLCS